MMEGRVGMKYEINLELQDTQWPAATTYHDRLIARAIVVDDEGYFYFVRESLDDQFGKAILIETSGGGVEMVKPRKWQSKENSKRNWGQMRKSLVRLAL